MDNLAYQQRQSCRILIVDDHPMVRNGIRFMLDSKNDQYQFRLMEAEDAPETLRKVGLHAFDIILLDYQLPGTQGPELAAQILKLQPDTRIVCMSSYTELMNIQKMISAGAVGYITKTIGALDLVTAIKELLSGKSYYSAGVANKLLESGRKTHYPATEIAHRLSPRELQILKLIAIEKTNKEIASELFVGERTVETHRKNLIQKLGVKNTAGLIRVGYELKILP